MFSLSRLKGLMIGLGLLVLFRLIWIGDIPYGNDDSQLFLRAVNDAQNHIFTSYGLLGSRGMNYGPFAIWTYRIGLFFTRDLLLFATGRIFITSLLIAFSITLVAFSSPFLVPSLGILGLLSPYIWLYGRDLWDNSYVIPLSGVAIAGYLYFCHKKSKVALFISLMASVFGVLTHLVYLPVAIGLAVHFVFYQRNWLKKNILFSLGSLGLGLVTLLPYLIHLLGDRKSFSSGGVSPNIGHIFMPFLGPRFYTAIGIEHFTGKNWYQMFPAQPILNGVWVFVICLSALAYLLAWYGMFLSAREVLTHFRDKKTYSERTEKFDACFIAIVIFIVELGLSFYLRLIPIANFYSPFWMVFLFFLWFGLSVVWEKRFAKAVFVLISGSLAVGLLGLVLRLHIYRGNRWNHYGPTLLNLLTIAREIEQVSPNAKVVSDTFHLSQFPLMMESLRIIVRPTVIKPSTEEQVVVNVKYADPSEPLSGELILLVK